MGHSELVLGFTLLVLFGGVSSASTNAPAKIVTGFVSNAVSMAMKSLWSLKATTKTAITGRPMMKFENGYTVETVFDGSKLGIEPYSVEVLPNGELLIMDSANSNLYRISSSLSLYSRPKLVAGSAEGYSGHVDGRPREARMNHPKGLTVDDRGNIYIADTVNMAIRKLSDAGVTTIAGGKWGRGGGHVDGPSEDAKFSDDFDVVYIGSSCSLLVIDRGNRAIREIQLHFDDCAYQYGTGFPLGIAMLLGAGFFGYMLALLQRRVGTIVSSQNDLGPGKMSALASACQKPLKSVTPPLIPTEDEQEKQEEGFFGSLGRLLVNTGTSGMEILGAIFPGFRRKPSDYQCQSQQQQKHSNAWPVQESFIIPDEDEPPSIETRTPTPRKTYPFMSKDAEKMHQLRQSRVFYNGWDDDLQQQHHHKYHSSAPHTFYEQSCEKTNEIVFGAVQEQDQRCEAAIIKPVDYGAAMFDHYNIRSRISSMGYNYGK
ncbi:NHL repeat [Parasponia andersonii]|uniref:NHL repeat n=1 Tax=Parasponia andersonii TaxID=3476 RepID=A0A2P5CE12_PARAD|nr:NHL repeat [Parasponia andersonii]